MTNVLIRLPLHKSLSKVPRSEMSGSSDLLIFKVFDIYCQHALQKLVIYSPINILIMSCYPTTVLGWFLSFFSSLLSKK